MKFKKIFAIILIIIMISTSVSLFVGCKKESEPTADYSIAVLSDTHVMAEAQIGDMTSPEFIEYMARGEKIVELSQAIYRTAIDNVLASGADALIICGDLTDDGGRLSHEAVAAELARLELSGVDIFVIPGNHDLNNKSYTYTSDGAERIESISADGFAELYADFGYSEAYSYYDEALLADTPEGVTNLSYTADIGDAYRLIAIDMCFYEPTLDENDMPYVINRHDGNMTEELLAWAEEATAKAVEDGKIALGTMHFPSMEHLGPLVQAIDMKNSKVNNPGVISVAETLMNAGMQIIFTGHVHMQDVMTLEKDGKILYDIETASTANYPNPVRYLKKYGDINKITTENIKHVKEEYIPDYIKAETRAEVIEDFAGFAYRYVSDSMQHKVLSKIDASMIVSLVKKLGFIGAESEAEELAAGIYNDVLLKFFNMPLYIKDAEDGELSVEQICSGFGITIPQSAYETVFDAAMAFVAGVYHGDENFTSGCTESVLLKYMLYSALYVIADFDLFDKLYGEGSLDLSSALPELFTEGKLETVQNDMLALIINNINIKAIRDKVPDVLKNNSVVIQGILKLALSQMTSLTLGIDLSTYLVYDDETKSGYIDIGEIIESLLFGEYTYGIFKDFGPVDNNLTLNIN